MINMTYKQRRQREYFVYLHYPTYPRDQQKKPSLIKRNLTKKVAEKLAEELNATKLSQEQKERGYWYISVRGNLK